MFNAGAPQFQWPQAVRYFGHQLNLWPSDARPRVTPVSIWTSSLGVSANYRVWGSLAHVCAPGTNKLSARTHACVFLGFTLESFGCAFYDPDNSQFFASQDVTFDDPPLLHVLLRQVCRMSLRTRLHCSVQSLSCLGVREVQLWRVGVLGLLELVVPALG
ncbi:unnamed protein product, partial [Closterium sp. NIES-53]